MAMNKNDGRSHNGENRARNSQGEFVSENSKNNSSHKNEGRSKAAKERPRDELGRFTD